ncbi:hypothetical protein NX801_25835 [Streptomyces sp. LP05-1]|uniref:Lipoprotein n=1 Tax=Streptomyces pyxinae TaxID=2970734 RepID=A0ABT2CR32_9ACTN|nr:hypothetical protein [Streptomyces sp. LP05-1]MCS0639004.1 hypothetical protein [Streptomyces sp. LP05-1]
MPSRSTTGSARAATALCLGIAALTVLTGCGGPSGDGGDAKDRGTDRSTPPTAPTAPTAPTGTAPAGPTGAPAQEGSWAGLSSAGKPVSLTIRRGKALVIAEARVCQGTATAASGAVSLALKCNDGDTTRASGTARPAKGSNLVVTWYGGTRDTLVKAAESDIPAELPTALPDSLPAAG